MTMSARIPKTEILRLFYALWPDGATRKALAQWQHGLRGRLVPAHNLHITLAFLGNQPAELLPVLKGILNRLDGPSMALELDRLGHFSRSRVAWAGMTEVPPELAQLHAALVRELAENGIRHDDRPQFVPHMTLARHVQRPPDAKAVEPVEWHADHVALVLSPMNGRPYELLASKRLRR